MRPFLVALVIAGCHPARAPVAPAAAPVAAAPVHHARPRADFVAASPGPLAEMIQTGHEPCLYVPERREPPPPPGPIRDERLHLATMPTGCPHDPMPPRRPLRY